jgi:lipopolysaccharide export system protein LptA
MPKNFNALKNLSGQGLILFLLVLGSGSELLAQKKQKIEFSAKSIQLSKHIGKSAKRLIGNVVLKHQSVIMYCDSAWLFDDNTLEAYRNIRILQGDSLSLNGDFLKYNGNTRKAEISKNITMTDREMVLTTDNLVYDMGTKTGVYLGGGTIKTSEHTLTSAQGYYYAGKREFAFKKNVVLTNPEYTVKCDTLRYNTSTKIAWFHGPTHIISEENRIYCENGFYDTHKNQSRFSRNAKLISGSQELSGDSLFYDRNLDYGKAMGKVQVTDSAENIIIRGRLAEYKGENRKSMITGEPYMIQIFEGDSIFLGADTLYSYYGIKKEGSETLIDEEARFLKAGPEVILFKYDLQGKCDSLLYSFADSTIRLFGKPVLWTGKQQLTAQTMEIKTSKGEIMEMLLEKTAFIVSEEDSGKYNQIRGKVMTGYFSKNELRKIRVEGNGQTLYFIKEEKQISGINKTDCSHMLIQIADNEISAINFYGKPEGTVVPPDTKDPTGWKLKDFIWRGGERPAGSHAITQRKKNL